MAARSWRISMSSSLTILKDGAVSLIYIFIHMYIYICINVCTVPVVGTGQR